MTFSTIHFNAAGDSGFNLSRRITRRIIARVVRFLIYNRANAGRNSYRARPGSSFPGRLARCSGPTCARTRRDPRPTPFSAHLLRASFAPHVWTGTPRTGGRGTWTPSEGDRSRVRFPRGNGGPPPLTRPGNPTRCYRFAICCLSSNRHTKISEAALRNFQCNFFQPRKSTIYFWAYQSVIIDYIQTQSDWLNVSIRYRRNDTAGR